MNETVCFILTKRYTIKPLKDHRDILERDEKDKSVISKGKNCGCEELYLIKTADKKEK